MSNEKPFCENHTVDADWWWGNDRSSRETDSILWKHLSGPREFFDEKNCNHCRNRLVDEGLLRTIEMPEIPFPFFELTDAGRMIAEKYDEANKKMFEAFMKGPGHIFCPRVPLLVSEHAFQDIQETKKNSSKNELVIEPISVIGKKIIIKYSTLKNKLND